MIIGEKCGCEVERGMVGNGGQVGCGDSYGGEVVPNGGDRDQPVGEVGEREPSACGTLVSRAGTVDGQDVSDIVLNTGCTHTMISEDLVSHDTLIAGASVQLRCPHGDVITYPLAEVVLRVNGVTIPVRAAIAKNLPVSVLLGTDAPELRNLLVMSPTITEDGQALVVTRAQAQEIVKAEEETKWKLQHSEVEPTAVWEEIRTIESCTDPPAFSELSDDLFGTPRSRKKLTRSEQGAVRHTYGLVRAKDLPQVRALLAEMPREEFRKLQETDQSLAGVRSLADAPSQPFFRRNNRFFGGMASSTGGGSHRLQKNGGW